MFKKTAYKIIDKGTPEQLRTFLKKNPDKVNERGGGDNTTPLTRAAFKGRADMLQVLLEFNAELDCMNKHMCNALILSSHFGHHDCVKLLLNAGADTTILDNRGLTAEQNAKNDSIKQLFINHLKAHEELVSETNTSVDNSKFCKDGNYLVSITEHTEVTKLSLTTVYNFKAQTVTYLQGTKESAPHVVPFNKAASPKELKAAAEYLQEKNGDTCGWKPMLIQ